MRQLEERLLRVSVDVVYPVYPKAETMIEIGPNVVWSEIV